MNLRPSLLVLLLCGLLPLGAAMAAPSSLLTPHSEFVPGRVIVTFEPSVQLLTDDAKSDVVRTSVASLDALMTELDVVSVRRLVPDGVLSRLRAVPDLYHTYVVQFNADRSVADAVTSLLADPYVRAAEPDGLRPVFRTPNDDLWSSQWDKRLMGAPQVWDASVGSRDIICVGIDTGVDWNHPDLVPALWVNPGEDLDHDSVPLTYDWYPGDTDDLNGEDDDGNGYVDDLLGWDFIHGLRNCAENEDCDSQTDNDMFGVNSHGTHVAGIMAATGNNGIGVAGMTWVGRLMALRAGFEDRTGQGYIEESAAAAAILYATAHGAKIFNMSYGGAGMSSAEREALAAAWTQGCMLFAASGNDGSTTPQYPANYDDVIAVNATDNGDRLAHWSNRGEWTDLCAPGSDPGIMSTVINGYARFWGTSMASPNAAGAAALVWSVFPEMTNEQLRDLLFSSAEDISADNPGVPPSHLGHGRVDVGRAVTAQFPLLSIQGFELSDATGGDGDGQLERGETALLTFTVEARAGWAPGEDVTAIITSQDPNLTISNGVVVLGDIEPGAVVDNSESPVHITASSALDTAYQARLEVEFSGANNYHAASSILFPLGALGAEPRDVPSLPTSVVLHEPYPNPFNASATITFELSAPSTVRLQVFDLTGRVVTTLTDGALAAGAHRVSFDGSSLASGIYIARLESGAHIRTTKLVLVK